MLSNRVAIESAYPTYQLDAAQTTTPAKFYRNTAGKKVVWRQSLTTPSRRRLRGIVRSQIRPKHLLNNLKCKRIWYHVLLCKFPRFRRESFGSSLDLWGRHTKHHLQPQWTTSNYHSAEIRSQPSHWKRPKDAVLYRTYLPNVSIPNSCLFEDYTSDFCLSFGFLGFALNAAQEEVLSSEHKSLFWCPWRAACRSQLVSDGSHTACHPTKVQFKPSRRNSDLCLKLNNSLYGRLETIAKKPYWS